MKLVFLDIDGVLNHEHFHEPSRVHNGGAFCPVSIQNLREIVKRTGAKIILTSSSPRGMSFIEIRELFSHYDMDAYILGKTPDLRDQIRGAEIKQLLDECSEEFIESFVILDDDADMGELMPYLVHCRDAMELQTGITGWRRELAIRMLNHKNERTMIEEE
jgi:DNA-binding LacI/PurR family transcriptional regulator